MIRTRERDGRSLIDSPANIGTHLLIRREELLYFIFIAKLRVSAWRHDSTRHRAARFPIRQALPILRIIRLWKLLDDTASRCEATCR